MGLLSHIGNTPLIALEPELALPDGVRLFAKLEAVNPGGSIKDRPISRIVTQALARGELDASSTGRRRRLLDSSSGNAGIAYAQFGALLGVDVTLVVPGNASRERLDRIRAHGAELILTDPLEGYDHAIETARQMAAEHPDLYWYADQYGNPDNWMAHYQSTGSEILEQMIGATGAPPAAFVAGVGTGGTLTGTGRRLREVDPTTHIAAVVPEIFPGIEGLKPLGSPGDLVPAILDEGLIDERIPVTIEEASSSASWLARRGLFVGPSSGAFVHAATQLALSGKYSSVVTLLNDTGERYGSTGLWNRPEAESAQVPPTLQTSETLTRAGH